MKAPHRTTISFPRGGIPNARGLYLLYAATSVLVPTHALPQTISDQAKASSCHLAIILPKREDNLKATGNESLLRAQHDVRNGCAPWKGGAFQWVQVPPGERSSRKQPEQLWR